MLEFFEQTVGETYAKPVMGLLAALILLALILVILRIFRGIKSGTFVMGGRNRKMRLAVMDATAIDANRRLVLVRRDDVEHLILIGGPNDVVVEQNIRLISPSRKVEITEPDFSSSSNTPPERSAPEAPRPASAQARRAEPQAPMPSAPVTPAPVAAPQPVSAPRPVEPKPAAPVTSAPAVQVEPVRERPALDPNQSIADAPVVSAYRVQRGDQDKGWVLHHENGAQSTQSAPAITPPTRAASPSTAPAPAAPAPATQAPAVTAPVAPRGADAAQDPNEMSLEEEMARLLDDLSDPKR